MALNNIDVEKIQDIDIKNSQNRQDFRDYMFVNEVELAQSVLNNNESLKTHYISPETMNKIRSAILQLQGYYFTNVDDFLDNLLTIFQENIDDLTNRGIYSSSSTYFPGNIVSYNGELYLCKKLSFAIDTSNDEYWVKLGLIGTQGSIGLGVSYIGEWNPSIEYKEKDMVIYNNNIYVSKNNNLNKTPSVTDENWCLALSTEERGITVSELQPINIWAGDYWWELINIL